MNLFESAKQLLQGTSKMETPEEYCPNCWGRQEYAGQFLTKMKENKIDLNNIDTQMGWIEAYAIRHFEGIKPNVSEGVQSCQSCNLTHSYQVPSKK